MPDLESWDRSGGAYEHPLITRAGEHYRDAYRLSEDRPGWPRNWLWSVMRHRGKRELRRVLPQATFFKAFHLELVVQPAFKLGYFPRIIVSHRSFAKQAVSLARMFSERTIDGHEAEYLRTYRNALMWLHTFGGCVVDYDDVVDRGSTGWISALAELTGLPADAIARSRDDRVSPSTAPGAPPPALAIRDDVLRIEALLKDLYGRVLPPSHAALRSWQYQGSGADLPLLAPSEHLQST